MSIHEELAAVLESNGSPLEFLLLKFQVQANDPTSQYFLPLLLSQMSDPKIYPALTADQWVFGLTGVPGTQAAQNICASTAPFGQVQVPTGPSAFPAITLGKSASMPTGVVTVQGLVNAKFGTPTVSGPSQDQVSVTIQFGAWAASQVPASLQPNWPPPGQALALNGAFQIVQACCIADTKNNCIPGQQNTQTGWGKFTTIFSMTTTAGAANVTGSAQATVGVASMSPPQVTVNVSQIALAVADYGQMSTSVDVSSIPPDQHRDQWNTQAAKALNDPNTKQSIVTNVNGVLGSQGNLTSIQNMLQQQINAYLQSLFG
jgi:hypothetical protein